MKKVEEIDRPLKLGEIFLVPCIVDRKVSQNDFELVHGEYRPCVDVKITPVINHLHDEHYHFDNRFHATFNNVVQTSPEILLTGNIEYFPLKVVNENPSIFDFSKESPIEECKHKGKCPHMGYDLKQVEEMDGIKTCPLHGTKVKVYKKLQETVDMTEILEQIDKETSEETRNKALNNIEKLNLNK